MDHSVSVQEISSFRGICEGTSESEGRRMSEWAGEERRGEGRGRRRDRRGREGLPGKRKESLPRAKNAVAFPGGLRKEAKRERGIQE